MSEALCGPVFSFGHTLMGKESHQRLMRVPSRGIEQGPASSLRTASQRLKLRKTSLLCTGVQGNVVQDLIADPANVSSFWLLETPYSFTYKYIFPSV